MSTKASAERCFVRSLKELRQVEKAAKVAKSGPEVGEARAALGSFLPAEKVLAAVEPKAVKPAPKVVAPASNARPKPVESFADPLFTPIGGGFEVPFSMGRAG